MSEYALFVGCVIANRYPHLEKSGRMVLENLRIKFKDIPEFGCCPNPTGTLQISREAWTAAAAHNLCLAEDKGLDILTFCNGCYETLKSANVEMKNDPHHKDVVNKILSKVNMEFKGSINVVHFLEYVYKIITPEKLKETVVKPLTGLRVATFYGCHYGRPSSIVDFDDPIRPVSLDRVVEALGATSVEYLNKHTCCGSAISGIDEDSQLILLKDKLEQIDRVKADLICVICPACYMQLDGNQRKVNSKFGTNYKIPVLYLTELIALAQGIPPAELGLNFHAVKMKELIEKF
ncbi:MAG: CoB--CoM heterodisulfide reductase iron-sulfur subunit B family protein [Candidatus Helarchaeota archaeon]